MLKIKELVNYISPNKIKQTSFLGPHLGKETKLMRLYEGIYYEKFKSDKEAIIALYGDLEVGSKYSKLKNNLESRLINGLLASDLIERNMDLRKKVYLKNFKIWAAANILVRVGVNSYGIKLLEKTIKPLLEYEFIILSLEASRILRNYYNKRAGDLKKGKHYKLLTSKLLEQYIAEIKISGFIDDTISRFIKQTSAKEALNPTLDRYIAEAEALIPKEMTVTLYYQINFLKVLRYMNVHDYFNAANICEQAVEYLENQKLNYRKYIATFLNSWIVCFIQLQRLESATDLVLKTLKYTTSGQFNWFKLMEYKTQLAFYKQDYQTAYTTYFETIKNKNFTQLPKPIYEEWQIYGAYAQFISLIGRVKELKTRQKKFRVQKFINEFELFTNDKLGYNIPIIVIQISFLIFYKRWNILIDKGESLDKYRHRYLCGPKHRRSQLFFRIIINTIKTNFDPRVAQQKNAHLIDELKAIPLNKFTTDHELEIIPYEIHWQLLLEILHDKANNF